MIPETLRAKVMLEYILSKMQEKIAETEKLLREDDKKYVASNIYTILEMSKDLETESAKAYPSKQSIS